MNDDVLPDELQNHCALFGHDPSTIFLKYTPGGGWDSYEQVIAFSVRTFKQASVWKNKGGGCEQLMGVCNGMWGIMRIGRRGAMRAFVGVPGGWGLAAERW